MRARPEQDAKSLVYYRPIEFQSDEGAVADMLRPNETLMVEIKLQRQVDTAVFRIDSSLAPQKIDSTPIGKPVP